MNPIQTAIDLWNASSTRIYGRCACWTPTLVKLYIVGDLLIWIAYLIIPLVLLAFTRQRKDLPFPWMFWMFGMFILGCGFTHFVEVYTIFWPNLWLGAGVKLFTAAVSFATIVALFPTMRLALRLRSPKELEALVRDRTGELERVNSALKNRAEELTRSNAELEKFTYVAYHDLQEPLRMVSSYTQLLARRYQGQLDTDADDFIGFAVDGAVRMQQLINDLLAYSRVGTLGKELAPTPADAAVQRAMVNLRTAIEESGAAVTRDLLPTVMADAGQMVELFQNLIGNAIKYRSDEPPRVHVSAVRDGAGWHFAVRDNGIGIDPQYAERVFEIFQRLHTRAQYPGTGIGLAICRKIVERHGGRIWVESQMGMGAMFHFTIQGDAKRNGDDRDE